MYSASRKGKGKKILEGWLPPLGIRVGGISLYNSLPAKPGSSLADRALETMLTGFETKGCLSFTKGLGLPMLRFPQRQNREIVPVIISPQSDVVIKMATKASCKIKKHNKTPTEEVCYLYLVFVRISEKALWLRTGIGFQGLFRNYCALYLIITSKRPLAGLSVMSIVIITVTIITVIE